MSSGRSSYKSIGEMNSLVIANIAHSVETYDGKTYIVLINGRMYDIRKRKEVFITKIFLDIKFVRNAKGFLLGRRVRKGSQLCYVIKK